MTLLSPILEFLNQLLPISANWHRFLFLPNIAKSVFPKAPLSKGGAFFFFAVSC
jgi:hypothetical protein